MPVVPRTALKQLSFFQSRLAKWMQNASAIGLSELEVADIEAKYDAARAAWLAQKQAQIVAQSATGTFHRLAEELLTAGTCAIMKIRSKARMEGGSVLTKASLPKRKKRSPVAAPGKPESFTVALTAMGEVTLKWTCKNPRNAEGTMYEVRRKVHRAGEPSFGPLEFLASTGKKRFTDSTVPAGTVTVMYEVTAIRSTRRGPMATHLVPLGVTGKIHPMMLREAA